MTLLPSRIVTLLTDFGTADPFVGVMKGVMLGRCPDLRLVDLTHEIGPQQVAEAAFWLAKCYCWFPPGTVHLAVVDPGVGTDRAALVAKVLGHLFVSPDNGLLSRVLELDRAAQVHRIEAARLGLPVPGTTFHGRDVFGPVAAELAAGGLVWNEVGPPHAPVRDLPWSRPVHRAEAVSGTVVAVDRFGNLITDIDAELLHGLDHPVVELPGCSCSLHNTYGAAASGEVLALVGSFGTIEIALRDGNAQQRLDLGRGTTVVVRCGSAG